MSMIQFQSLKKQFPEADYEMKTLRRFKFAEAATLEIYFERKLTGGWQLALESSSNVNSKIRYCTCMWNYGVYFRTVILGRKMRFISLPTASLVSWYLKF